MSGRIRSTLAVSAVALAALVTSSPAGALPAYTTSPATYTNTQVTGQPKIVGLRVSKHASFDRVVIDVEGRRPSFSVQYVDQLRYDASGKVVPLQGQRKVAMRISPAKAHSSTGANLYMSPRLQQYTLPTLRGAAFTGDFEGVVSFGFTTDRRAPYRIFTLTNPSRLVIDFQH